MPSIASRASSLYEYTICILVALLLSNAVTLYFCFHAESLKPSTIDKSNTKVIRFLPLGAVAYAPIVAAWPLLFNGVWTAPSNLSIDFIDLPCYASGLWPIQVLRAALAFPLSPMLMIFPLVAYYSWGCCSQRGKKHGEKLGVGLLWVVSFVGLWVDFGLIVYVRNRALSEFGASNTDTNFGYGQVLSIGLPAQFIWTICYRWIGIQHFLVT